MGSWLLVLHLSLGGTTTLFQDRFTTEELCHKGAVQFEDTIGKSYSIGAQNHTCIFTGVVEY